MKLPHPILRKVRPFMYRRVPFMMTCRAFEDFIVDYLDARLPKRQRVIFKLHVAMCPECRAYLASYRQTIALGRAACRDPQGPVSQDVPEELISAILAAREREVRTKGR